MTIQYYTAFFTLSFLICLAPGPSMLFVIHQGLSGNWKNVVVGTSGLIVANFIWITLCALGIGALMQGSQQVLLLLKTFGALYLIYLGLNALFSKQEVSWKPNSHNSLKSYLSIFVKGVLTSLSNPKALLFYIAFLPQFLTGSYSYGHEILLLGTMNLAVISIVMLSYGLLSNKLAQRLNSSFMKGYIRKILGVSFIAFGVSLFRYRPA